MIKRFSKLLVTAFIILAIISCCSICFATETKQTAVTTSETTEDASQEATEEIHEGDLYLFDNDITMDELVDGNVYIIGNNITISGQVNGNLFVLGNSVKFENCYLRYSIYACANNIYYNGACNDLYAMSQKLEMTYDSYVVRDVKAGANTTIFKAAVGRDVDLQTNSVDFGADTEVPIIYGDLRYSANEEKSLSDDIVTGEITYSKHAFNQSLQETIIDIIVTFALVIVTSLVLYFLLNKFKPECLEKLHFKPFEILKALGLGLATIIAASIVFIILLLTSIGAKLGLILLVILILIGLFAMPVVAISVTNILKPVLKIGKAIIYYVVLALVSIVLYGLTLVPFGIGSIISLIIILLGYGFIVINVLPKKELSEEDLAIKLQNKEAKKALKEEKKAEKAKLKEAKKAEKENLNNTNKE